MEYGGRRGKGTNSRLQIHSPGCSPAWSLLPSRTKWWWDGGGGFATVWTPWWKQSQVLPAACPWVCARGLPPSERNLTLTWVCLPVTGIKTGVETEG